MSEVIGNKEAVVSILARNYLPHPWSSLVIDTGGLNLNSPLEDFLGSPCDDNTFSHDDTPFVCLFIVIKCLVLYIVLVMSFSVP